MPRSPSEPLPTAAFWAWLDATGDTRAQLWSTLLPHVGAFMRSHRGEMARSLTGEEVTSVLLSEHADSFLEEIAGVVLTWLLLVTHKDGVVHALITHAPWGRTKTGRRAWIGSATDATALVLHLIKQREDAQALAFAQSLPMPLLAKRFHPAAFLNGAMPLFARYALGCPRTGQDAQLVTPQAFAAKVQTVYQWRVDMGPMLALAWTRGLTPHGSLARVTPTPQTEADDPDDLLLQQAYHRETRSLTTVSNHQKMAFLQAHHDPYACAPNPQLWGAVFG